MQIPPVMFIEAAMSSLAKCDPKELDAELGEFFMLGDRRMDEITLDLKDRKALGAGPDYNAMAVGYLLGLQTARMLLATNPSARKAGVTL